MLLLCPQFSGVLYARQRMERMRYFRDTGNDTVILLCNFKCVIFLLCGFPLLAVEMFAVNV